VPEAVADTGPVLHLQEIGKLETLALFSPLILSTFVAAELEARGVVAARLREATIDIIVAQVNESEWMEILELGPQIQPADAQVFALVRARRYQVLALTDDLTLRRLLESHGAQVTGTVGVLVRAYSSRRLSRSELEGAIEALFDDSSLFISRAFRLYVKKLLADLPDPPSFP